jgi:hypothetical protein
MYIVDCGANSSTLYDSDSKELKTLSHLDILNLPFDLPRKSIIVSEYAHLGCPRKNLSRSQPFTEEQLKDLYSNCKRNKIQLKLFPQQSTKRACNYAQLEKSDKNDPIAIHKLLEDFPEISLMNPPKHFHVTERRQEAYDFKFETNEILNIARRFDQPYKDEADANAKFIKENIENIANNVSDTTKDIFGLNNKYKKTGKINLNKVKLPQIYTILSLLQDYNGNLRLRKENGKLPSWSFIKRYVLCMTPFHLKGGVARSNLYFHGLRHWVADKVAAELKVTKKEIMKKRRGGYYNEAKEYIKPFTKKEDRLYRKYRAEYCNGIRELFNVMKEELEKQF